MDISTSNLIKQAKARSTVEQFLGSYHSKILIGEQLEVI